MALAAIDRWTLGYAVVVTAAVLWRPLGLEQAALLLLSHAGLAMLALLAPRLRARGGVAAILAEFYALILTVGLYTEVGVINTAAGVSHDVAAQAWEQAVFGGQPSLDWIRAQPWPWLAWPLHLGYLSYYFILAGSPLLLWASGRRDAARRTLLLMMAVFYFCYTAFLLFPVAGPRFLFPLPRNAATETAVAALTHRLLENGSAWGTAFPSSHVAVALVASVCAWRAWRALGAVLVPASVLLAFGTVYGQFHYAVDALAGVLVAAIALALGRGKMPAA